MYLILRTQKHAKVGLPLLLPRAHVSVTKAPNIKFLLSLTTLTIVRVGTFPSHLAWNVVLAQPSLVARQHTLQCPACGNHSPSFVVKFSGPEDNISDSKGGTTLLKKGVLNQHTFYVQKTTHLKVCYSSTPLGVLFACPENNTPLGVF